MSFITTDYSNLKTSGFEALPTGEYEVIINNAQEQATPSGAESLQLDLIVRNDVKNVPELAKTNGKYSNRHVFVDNWKRKATNEYDTASFMYILDAVGVPEGTPINSVNDFMDLIRKKPVRVYVKKEVDDYRTTDNNNPEYKNQVAPWNFSATKYKDINHQDDSSGNKSEPSPQVILEESDYPF